MITHPVVISTAAFFAVALMARYAQADQVLSLIVAFPYGVFAYAQTQLHQYARYRDLRKRNLEYFILFFVLLYAIAGLRYIAENLFGEISQAATRILALFIIGFGLACVSLGRLNTISPEEMENREFEQKIQP